ncbi:extracellular solute-binding protein [Enterococcus mundtii]|uniref:ABC transporter substrate-binding protein n=1 Tax=Enterococcus mundtii TaxID=53346 RepID=A0A2S7RWF7_ENTMU|nr:extracellular solute-binding protein [Enterococcus mundtii]PQF24256.1 ABC transporter substrate-binding protein [Enterococcus mundtii]
MKKWLVAGVGILSIILAGCGSANGDTSENSSNAASSSESKEETGSTELSGEVYVYLPSPANLGDQLAADFEEQTGVRVNVFQGTTGEILARLEAESANPVADVIMLASWSDGLGLKADDALMPYLPEGADNLHEGWADADNMLFGASGSAVGVIYNTTLFPELDADWDELASEEYQGELAFPDPEKSGSAKDFLAGFINNKGEEAGWQTWKDLAANGMTIPGANAAALEEVTTGAKGILVGGVDWNAYDSISKGEALEIYYPEGGTVVNPRTAMILNSSRNVDNAKAFMDYLLSDRAQQLISEAYLIPGRSDITSTQRENLSDINTLDVDWDWMMEHASDITSEFLSVMESSQ